MLPMHDNRTLEYWLYDRVLKGVPGFAPIHAVSHDCRQRDTCPNAQVSRLIRWHVTHAGTAALLTSWGGFATLPFALSVTFLTERFLAFRLVAGVAALHEWPLEDPDTFQQVRTCVSGHLGKAGAGSHTLKGLGQHALQESQTLVLKQLGKTPFKSAARALPLISIAVSVGLDSHAMYRLGKKAQAVFGPQLPAPGLVVSA